MDDTKYHLPSQSVEIPYRQIQGCEISSIVRCGNTLPRPQERKRHQPVVFIQLPFEIILGGLLL